ncbi:putative membrane protein YphA (DoxX/SURF4 family) [Dyadobacter sp. BE34]|uniref:Membrane protein YphA (DoxX/SURF4 family) n=1 Tax=Dyadobacter fermentans TaxID=94254 RepID=A0ABU1R076_9BACT|nr:MULTISPECIES: DoxX family membrane protein [Dyadobacter]MDR6806809.1 putative membrane protein YphA (DoxX/SURF4 family) [Dyadobacter fermentans]MDR7044551.1 putative membrane protein YphA (DoxX/SURF4 family) [Dyadobacter sp. BE242]MDR7198861.1 putative membrane protein YphA (DoxX/SURF4 family) [Dyadobacter sp. BE34]MDR7216823.1 putative membrane protein YphA (DoxX/SURF4 family) [Dyadobacter sp. BE31]MDR7263651.1 putative membrane protein YphA (DoxX/SURF4 family) [Dyadobacter sp. BE32]
MKQKILSVLCLLTGLMFINAGLDKFLHYMPIPADLPEKMIKTGMAFAQIGWLMPLVGAVEMAGGVLLAIPRTRALGAIVLLPVLAGVLLTNITAAPSGLPIVAIFVAVIGWVIADNWGKYLPIVSR